MRRFVLGTEVPDSTSWIVTRAIYGGMESAPAGVVTDTKQPESAAASVRRT